METKHENERAAYVHRVTEDPNEGSSWIQQSAGHLSTVLSDKNQDYAPTGEFSNFEKAADVAGISVLQVMVAQAAIKMTRVQSLLSSDVVESNEPLQDSLLDLAGYALIAHAYLESVKDD